MDGVEQSQSKMSQSESPRLRKSQRSKAIRLDYSALDEDGAFVPAKRSKQLVTAIDRADEVKKF